MSQVVKESRATMTAKLKRAKLPVPLKITHCHISSFVIIFKILKSLEESFILILKVRIRPKCFI